MVWRGGSNAAVRQDTRLAGWGWASSGADHQQRHYPPPTPTAS